MNLPLEFPFPPMEAETAAALPRGPGWLYEPKWDGFRCLAFRDGEDVRLQSKAGKPLGRYFPDVIAAVGALSPRRFVLDGEIVIPVDGRLSFDELLLRVHPAESRVRKLATEHPAENSALWRAAGYEAAPTIAEMVRELAALPARPGVVA